MKALILGSTGLVGREVLDLLLNDKECVSIVAIGRRSSGINDPKLTSYAIDLESLAELPEMDVDTLFVAFGTTLKTAGSKERQEFIDVEIPTRIMELAHKKGVRRCALVSAVGVSESSPFFYSRMKARLDRNARQVGFDHLVLVKPSVLDGDRKEERFGEKLSIRLGNFLGKSGLFNAYKPVHVKLVAGAMINAIKKGGEGTLEISNSEIPLFASNN
jgi:uncharacterized protein YbjT (DUF2867 family)